MKLRKDSCLVAIVPAALFGLLMRGLGTEQTLDAWMPIASFTFMVLVPACMGIIPALLREHRAFSRLKNFMYPIWATAVFGLLTLATGLEDVVCLLIIGVPFLLIAGVVGLIAGELIYRRQTRKKGMAAFLILPLICGPVETFIITEPEAYEVVSTLEIDASVQEVWSHLKEVPDLDSYYQEGWLQAIGIPRPRYSELVPNGGDTLRLGHFTQGFVLTERIEEDRPNAYLEFSVWLEESQLRDAPSDQHILQSGYFDFNKVAYTLEPTETGGTRLTLTCGYTLKTRVNTYGSWWAETVIEDFETRLLHALKQTIERHEVPHP